MKIDVYLCIFGAMLSCFLSFYSSYWMEPVWALVFLICAIGFWWFGRRMLRE